MILNIMQQTDALARFYNSWKDITATRCISPWKLWLYKAFTRLTQHTLVATRGSDRRPSTKACNSGFKYFSFTTASLIISQIRPTVQAKKRIIQRWSICSIWNTGSKRKSVLEEFDTSKKRFPPFFCVLLTKYTVSCSIFHIQIGHK